VAADIRNFSFPGCFNAVLSNFDSMSHLLSLQDLNLALLNVHGALATGGMLVFDLNMAEAFIKNGVRAQRWQLEITCAKCAELMRVKPNSASRRLQPFD
jgi:hypothetical protein